MDFAPITHAMVLDDCVSTCRPIRAPLPGASGDGAPERAAGNDRGARGGVSDFEKLSRARFAR